MALPNLPKDQLLEDLKGLRDVFTPMGSWKKGAWGDPGSQSMCMEGGMARVMGLTRYEDVQREKQKNTRLNCLYKAIEGSIPKRYEDDIPEWNDMASRRKADIIKAIDKAITRRVEDLTLWQAQQAAEKVDA